MYAISVDDSEIGYIRGESIIPDKNAPNDAYSSFINEQAEILTKQHFVEIESTKS